MTGHSTEPYQPVFTGETKARLEALATKYPNRQALLLPSLWMVQEARGWVAPEAIHEIAEMLQKEGLKFGMKFDEVDGDLRITDHGSLPAIPAASGEEA